MVVEVADENQLMLELQQQQQLIESLLATQRALLEQRDSLSEDLSQKMSQLWSDVSMEPSSRKKKRGVFDVEVDDCEAAVYRSSIASLEESSEVVTYRSLGDIELDESDLGLGDLQAEVGAVAAAHALECAADSTNTFRSAAVAATDDDDGADGGDGPSGSWALARRVEILMEIGRRLKVAPTRGRRAVCGRAPVGADPRAACGVWACAGWRRSAGGARCVGVRRSAPVRGELSRTARARGSCSRGRLSAPS